MKKSIIKSGILITFSFLCCFLLFTACHAKNDKNKNKSKDQETTMGESIPLSERLEGKFKPFGKEMSHGDYKFILDGIYVNYDGNIYDSKLWDYEMAYHIIIDGKNDISEDCGYLKSSSFYFILSKTDEVEKYYRLSFSMNAYADKTDYEYIIESGNIHLYLYLKGTTTQANLKKRVSYLSVSYKEDIKDVYPGISESIGVTDTILSAGMQYYEVEGNDLLVTDYGVMIEEDFKIDEIQLHLKNGNIIIPSKQPNELLLAGSLHLLPYDEIYANDVEYIEINGKTYYPEGYDR